MHPIGPLIRYTLRRLDHASAEEIRDFQERRLRALVRFAALRSPFYRRWFHESGTSPREIRTLDDIGLLPLIDRGHLADRPHDFLTCPGRLVWSARSSGTSGVPITAYRTPGSSVYELAALERQWSWFGLRRGARRAVLRGSLFANAHPGGVTLEQVGSGQILVSSYHLTKENLPNILAGMRKFRPNAVEGWPSSISLLAELLRDAGERFPVDAVITSSEVMSSMQRAAMVEVFAGPIIDHYGQTERVVMAGNCPAGSYHVFGDYGIAELLPVEGVADRWEIVGTGLHNWGAPLLRYRTGDQVGPAPAASCLCGRAHPTLGVIDGRVEDSFTGADGRRVPQPASIFDNLVGLKEAQVRQRAPGSFLVLLVPGRRYDGAVAQAQVRRNVEDLFGAGQVVSIEIVDRVPRTAAGKLKAAVVENDLA
jgi:phenylacetate-CoA ligase